MGDKGKDWRSYYSLGVDKVVGWPLGFLWSTLSYSFWKYGLGVG